MLPKKSRTSQTLARKILTSPFLLLCILLTLAGWALLIFQIPLLQNLEYWFWPLRQLDSPQYLWIISILLINFGALAFILRFPDKFIRNIILLIIVGYATQHMFALVEGRGLDGIRDRLVITGHADFAFDAASPPSIRRVMHDYRSMIDSGELHRYPHSTKPPGHFIVYILTSRLAQAFPEFNRPPFEQLATFTVYFFPLLTYLALIPLFALARLYLPLRQTYLALILFMVAPNLNLITLHLDQALYPFLFILPIILYLYGRKHENKTLLLLSGLTIAGAVYISFSLIAVIAVIGLLGLFSIWNEKRSFMPMMKHLVLVGIGFLVFELFLFFIFDYNILGDYRYVMAQHQVWKANQWTAPFYFYVGALDMLEFALWIGFPLALFSLSWMLKSLSRWRQNGSHVLAMSVLISLLLLAFLGKTVAETARLWIFLLPGLALFATQDLSDRYPLFFRPIFTLIMGMQLLSTYFIKLFQDFH